MDPRLHDSMLAQPKSVLVDGEVISLCTDLIQANCG